MKKTAMLTAIMLALCAFAFEAAWAEGPAALVVKVDGTVKVQRGGKQKQISGKFALAWGDKVIAESGGSAQLLFSNGKKVNVKGTFEVTEANAKIDGKAGGAASGAASLVMGSAGGSKKDADLRAKGGVGGAVRAAGPADFVHLVSYLNTATTSTHPVFAWESSAEPSKTTVKLMNADGEEIWATETKEMLAAYPKDKPALEAGGEFTVEVTSIIKDDPITTSSTFYVLSEKEAKDVEESVKAIKESYATDDDQVILHMLLAQYYKQKELFMDATDEFKKLIALDANDFNSYKELADIYFKIGLKDEGTKALKKLDEIEKKVGDSSTF